MKSFERIAAVLVTALAFGGGAAGAQEVLRLCDFETPDDVKAWDYVAGKGRIVQEGVAHGKGALEIAFDPKGQYHPAYVFWQKVRRDWSAYDALVLDVLNPNAEPIPGSVLIADQAWADKGRSYWNRHNSATTFAPGRTRWVIPVRGLYRGEAGSRNNDIKRDIDPDSIVRVDFGFGRKGTAGRVIIDDLRLVKGSRPQGVWAYDFGPASQSVLLGWTEVSPETRYTKARGYGWGPGGGGPWQGAARDTTFGSPLLRDSCEAGGYRFHIDVPPGEYRVTVFYENSGYWGGEQAMHSTRRILVDGREVWAETRPDGAAHALWRFENVEPVGVDIWDTYMAPELAKPGVFQARAGDNGLTLAFEADRVWGSKVAALALHRAGDAKAAKWLADELDGVAAAFRAQAVCLDKPPEKFQPSSKWKDVGLVAWPVRIEDDVTPASVPPPGAKDPGELRLEALAVRGEAQTLCLALRPLRDCGRCQIGFDWQAASGKGSPPRSMAAGGPKLPVELNVVWYNTSRGFGSIAYHVMPHALRAGTSVALPADVTREVVLKVRVPEDAAPGEYVGRLLLKYSQGHRLLTVPVRLTVHGVSLDRRTDFQMGFFGLMPPSLLPQERRWAVLDRTLAMLREYGMNMVCGGPDWTLTGWKDGEPQIDFGETDRFFALLARHGFIGPVNGYGGLRFRGLHDGYQKGAAGAKAQKESGLSYQQALLSAWQAVDKHARAANWAIILYAMCDETRVRDVAERELEFMRMMANVSAAMPHTVRTSGSYSVDFRRRPTDKDDLLYWHQRFFEALDISSLNSHDASVMAEAKKLGKEVHIYNQGQTRYSFGLYQWSEFRKGIRSRTQWHLNVLHGYQFFDLDGREPDTAMLCYGRSGLYPTIHFERCREGAEDFYLYNALWRLITQARRRGRGGAAVDAASALLENAANSVQINQRTEPEGFDADAFKAKVVAAIEALK